LNAGAASIVLASFFSDEELKKLTGNMAFTAFTPNTITDKAIFMEKVKEARQSGWACLRSDYSLGVISIAVPVKNYFRPLALSILGPEASIGDNIVDIIPELQKSADVLSEKIREEGWTLM
jgi:IclR family transcriptional regulator, KDG regulon repressor